MTPYYKRLSTPVDVIFPSSGTGGGAGQQNFIPACNLQFLQLLIKYAESKNDSTK